MDKYILGLDPSTKSSGWSIFNNTELVAHGVITAGSADVFKRIDKIIEELDKVLQQYPIQDCIIEEVLPEDVKYNNNVFKPLMYLQGFICHLLDKYNIKPSFFVASEWRKKCGIKTGAGVRRESLKPKDKAFVQKMYGLDVNDDEADAICIGFAYTNKPIPVTNEEIVKTEDGFEFG